MGTTKARTSIWSSQVLTAGGGDTTSAAVDLTDGYGGVLSVRLANGATGPTDPARVQVEVSHDNTAWYDYGSPLVGGTDNDGIYEWCVPLDIGVQYLRLVAGSNTEQDVTVDAEVTEVTAI